jgi:hypothetical protein
MFPTRSTVLSDGTELFTNNNVGDNCASLHGSGVIIEDGALIFDGIQPGYLQLPAGYLQDATSATIEMWASLESSDAGAVLFSFGAPGSDVSFEASHMVGHRHLCFVLNRDDDSDSTQVKVYIDGIEDLSLAYSISEAGLIGGRGLYDDYGFVGTNSAIDPRFFKGRVEEFRIWWGALDESMIFDTSLKGFDPTLISLPDSVTQADVVINFYSLSMQAVQVEFYGDGDEPVNMFPDVLFKATSLTCAYTFSFQLDPTGEAFEGYLPAMSYNVELLPFEFDLSFYESDLSPCGGAGHCSEVNSLDPYNYLLKENQLIKNISLFEVRSSPYLVSYIYRSPLCMTVLHTENFLVEDAVGGNPSCFPLLTTVLNQSQSYDVVIVLYERYPSDTEAGSYRTKNLSDATLTITDSVSRKDSFRTPYQPDTPTGCANNSLTGLGYTIIPGPPSFSSPFFWEFRVLAERLIDSSVVELKWAIPVTGVVANPLPTLIPISTQPDLIFTILRDPPGGGSYTTFSRGSSFDITLGINDLHTIERSESYDIQVASNIHVSDLQSMSEEPNSLLDIENYENVRRLTVRTPLGKSTFAPTSSTITRSRDSVDIPELPVNTVQHEYAGGGNSRHQIQDVSSSRESRSHYTVSFSFSSDISTSSDPNTAGHASDVIVGGGMDLMFVEGNQGISSYYTIY